MLPLKTYITSFSNNWLVSLRPFRGFYRFHHNSSKKKMVLVFGYVVSKCYGKIEDCITQGLFLAESQEKKSQLTRYTIVHWMRPKTSALFLKRYKTMIPSFINVIQEPKRD